MTYGRAFGRFEEAGELLAVLVGENLREQVHVLQRDHAQEAGEVARGVRREKRGARRAWAQRRLATLEELQQLPQELRLRHAQHRQHPAERQPVARVARLLRRARALRHEQRARQPHGLVARHLRGAHLAGRTMAGKSETGGQRAGDEGGRWNMD